MRVLITGKGSYIGSCVRSHLEAFGYSVDEADTENEGWRKVDLSQYGAVVHVAAIVHQNAKNADHALFQKVNVDLPVTIAESARKMGVKHFVFLSTMGVYGLGKTLSPAQSVITEDTPESAEDGYGGSKLAAEKLLRQMENDDFRVAVVRPPNVYGPGCRGNYIPLFRKIALKSAFCPYAFTDIRQSMLYIDNLSELVRLILENRSGGVYLPQDDIAPNTVEMIRLIRRISGKKTHDSKLLGLIVRLFRKSGAVTKLYGGVRYDDSLSDCFDARYRIVGFVQGMESTIGCFSNKVR